MSNGTFSKRQIAIALAVVAGYHNDRQKFTRLIVESRVARPTMNRAWQNGQQQKAAGIPCYCRDCDPRFPQAIRP